MVEEDAVVIVVAGIIACNSVIVAVKGEAYTVFVVADIVACNSVVVA